MDQPEQQREKPRLVEAFERLWEQALVAVTTAEEEAFRAVSKVGSVAGWSQEEVRRLAREMSERLIRQRTELERGVEDGVHRAIAAMKVPKRDQLQEVQRRLAAIAERIDALESRK